MSQLDLFAPPPILTRQQAVERLTPYFGHNLRDLSDRFGFTRAHHPAEHKGWAGYTIEKLCGQSPNNEHGADFGDWELKVLSFTYRTGSSEELELKSQLTLTMVQPKELENTSFEKSYLWAKTRQMLVVGRIYTSIEERTSPLLGYALFDVLPDLQSKLTQEYEMLQWMLRSHGVSALKDFQGQYLGLQLKKATERGWSFIAQRALINEILKNFEIPLASLS